MSEFEKTAMLRAMSGETDERVLTAYLSLAAQKVILRAYPYRRDITEVPERYAVLQVEIACYLLNKRGAEGQTVHSENGISRTYESADVPESMLKRIIPCASVI